MIPSPSQPWQIRFEGIPETVRLSAPEKVLEGLRDGDWEPSDEVKGPADADWQAIEDHPTFADAVAEMGPPPKEPEDETRLDMNPLIDVSLVLLIFFILTTSYATLRRVITLPPAPPEEKAAPPRPDRNPLEDRVFRVKVSTDGERVVVQLDGTAVDPAKLAESIRDVMRLTGKREMYLSVTDDVYWEDEAKVHDAAKGAGVHQIHMSGK
jgi:biopolymer transport protein ExbD